MMEHYTTQAIDAHSLWLQGLREISLKKTRKKESFYESNRKIRRQENPGKGHQAPGRVSSRMVPKKQYFELPLQVCSKDLTHPSEVEWQSIHGEFIGKDELGMRSERHNAYISYHPLDYSKDFG